MSNLPSRNDLSRIAGGFNEVKINHEKVVADIDKQIADLLKAKADAEHQAFIAAVKQKALRAAVRVMEDEGVI